MLHCFFYYFKTIMTTTTTKSCPKCQEDIQVNAKKCKHCSADLRNWFARHRIISTLLWLFILWGVISSFWTTPQNSNTWASNSIQPEIVEENIKISSTQLYQEYEENEIKADDKYKNKTLEIDWTIESIWKDILDSMYVALKWDWLIFSIQCMLKWSEKEKAINLNEWEYITVVGKNSWKLWNVLIRNCVIK